LLVADRGRTALDIFFLIRSLLFSRTFNTKCITLVKEDKKKKKTPNKRHYSLIWTVSANRIKRFNCAWMARDALMEKTINAYGSPPPFPRTQDGLMWWQWGRYSCLVPRSVGVRVHRIIAYIIITIILLLL